MAFTLYILRHAKSDWSSGSTADIDRPLNKRGQKAAKRIGRWMYEENQVPEQIICSPALRAKQTIGLVTSKFPGFVSESIVYDQSLYLADLDTLFETIELYQKDRRSLMIVGHNPGLEYLLNYLITKSDKDIVKEESFTTANLAIFMYSDQSFDPATDECKFINLIRPRELD